MSVAIRRLLFLLPLLFLSWSPAHAEGVVLQSCADAQGRAVISVEDEDLPVVAQAVAQGGQAAVHYNPAMLPQLSTQARVFLAARECARIALRQALAKPASAAQARKADCWALAAMRASGMLPDAAAVASLQSDLQFSDQDWKSLSGPQRHVNLAACSARDGALRMPAADMPGPARERADHCVHACGDRLWQCQRACKGSTCRADCEQTFNRCEAGCGQ